MNKNLDPQREWAARQMLEARRLLSAGRAQDAEALLQEILQRNPKDQQAMLALGILAAETGQTELAARRFGQVLAIDPRSLPALCWMALLHFNANENTESRRYARQAISIEPRNGVMQAVLARSAAALGDSREALEAFEKALALTPNDPQLQYDFAGALMAVGQEREAASVLRKLLAVQTNPVAELRLAYLELSLGRIDEAERLCRSALTKEPNHAQGHGLMGRILMEQQRLEEADDHWDQAMELDPSSGSLNFQRAVSLNAIGRFDEALGEMERSIAANPLQGQAYQSIVFNKKITQGDQPLITQMERLLDEKQLSDNDRLSLLYSLGKSFDNLGDPEKAMRHFDAANALKLELRPTKSFDRNAFKSFIDSRIAMFNRERFESNKGAGIESSLPILIVGMMRSGTTLGEQMLSCHPLVGGAGEQHFWGDHENEMIDFVRQTVEKQRIQKYANDFEDLLSSLVPRFPHVIDKNPANIQVLGSFHMGFPNARIIHMRRNAVDTALSMWMTPVKSDAPFLNDQSNIAYAYKQCIRLMDHWKQVLPSDRYCEVRYEELVDRPEEILRPVVEFCGLEWDEKCIHPELNDRRIKTPSMWQARQPVYRSSSGKWKAYEKFLGPFAELKGLF